MCLWRVLHINNFRIPIQLHLCDHIQIRIRSTNSKVSSDKLVCFFAKHHGRQKRHQDWYRLRVRVLIDVQSPASTSLHKMVKAYYEAKDLARDSLRFLFDGDRIPETATVMSLGLEHGDWSVMIIVCLCVCVCVCVFVCVCVCVQRVFLGVCVWCVCVCLLVCACV